MSEGNNKNVEREAVKEAPAAAAEQGREALSNHALEAAIKGAQAAGSSVSDTKSAPESSSENKLPKITLEDTTAHGSKGSAKDLGHDSKSKDAADAMNNAQNGEMAKHIGEAAKNAAEIGKSVGEKESLTKQADKLSDLVKEGKLNPEDLNTKLKDLFKPKDGVEQLATGDYVVREDGKQTLFTPNGDRVTINPDGSHSIKGDVREVKTSEDGTTTVTFGDGARVQFDADGLLSVQRGNEGVGFARPGHIGINPHPWGGKPNFPMKPDFPEKPDFPGINKPWIGKPHGPVGIELDSWKNQPELRKHLD